MSGLRVCLFGRFAITCGDASLSPDATKARELLAYLLLHRDQAHYREKLATLLWADSDPSRSKGYLRQALWQLQSALGDHCDLLAVDSEWIRINPEANLRLDVACFEQAATATRGIHGADLTQESATALEEASALYCADLLEHWFHDWCVFERERLHNIHLAILEKLMSYFQVHGHYEEGIAYAMRLLRCEPAHERTYRFLMRLHALDGNRTAALRAYERCTAALAEGLGVEPSLRTTSLYEQIQKGHLPAGAVTSPTPDETVGGILTRLEQLERTLVDAQQQVTREIEALRRALLKS